MDTTHWIVHAFWYNSIVMSIVSAVMTFQQSSALGCILAKVQNHYRLDVALLKGASKKPSRQAVFVLQAPIQLLMYSISVYLLGLIMSIIYPVAREPFGNPQAKVKQ